MKTIKSVTLGLGTIMGLMASAKGLKVEIANMLSEERNAFSISVATVEQHSSMCGMQVTQLSVIQPLETPLDVVQVGELNLNFKTPLNQMCLMAFGPHRGYVEFQIGQGLPNLSGLYKLTMNGEVYGNLSVSDSGAVLEEIVEAN